MFIADVDWHFHNKQVISCVTCVNSYVQVFTKGIDADMVVLMAARASRTENQDAIDAAIVGMLADPKEVIHIFYNK